MRDRDRWWPLWAETLALPPRALEAVWAKTSKDDRVFFVRMNNSTRSLPDGEIESYLGARRSEAG